MWQASQGHLWLLTILTLYTFIAKGGVQAKIQRCFERFGCFDVDLLNALPQDPDYVRTEFRLSCPQNTNNVIIKAADHEMKWKSVLDKGSCFQVDRETVFIIHGFRDQADSNWVTAIRNFLVTQKNFNVFAVDWKHGAGFLYEQAAANTHLVAKQLSLFLQSLEQFKGLDPRRIHLIGHSLGAHVAGNAGHDLNPYKVARITGLDPAQPYFDQVQDDQRLDASDAIFVDVIHTDGERFTGFRGFGSKRAQGHVDFYPNGGEKQPGCEFASFFEGAGCSHSRAHELFIQSLTSTDCLLQGLSCPSWDDFNKAKCTICPFGGCVPIGMDTPSSARGIMYFGTTSVAPFCGYTYFLEISTTSSQKDTYGHLKVNILDTNTTHNPALVGSGNQHFHQSEVHRYAVTVPKEVEKVEQVKMEFVKDSGSLSAIGAHQALQLKELKLTSFGGQRSWVLCNQTELYADQSSKLLQVTEGKKCY